MRLLLIEDDPSLRKILTQRLTQEGYAVDSYDNGLDGLSYALATPYDGILLDIILWGWMVLRCCPACGLRAAAAPFCF